MNGKISKKIKAVENETKSAIPRNQGEDLGKKSPTGGKLKTKKGDR